MENLPIHLNLAIVVEVRLDALSDDFRDVEVWSLKN